MSAGLQKTGKKADLIARLTEFLGSASGPVPPPAKGRTAVMAGGAERKPRAAAVSDVVEAAAAEERSATEDIVVRGREARIARWAKRGPRCSLRCESCFSAHADAQDQARSVTYLAEAFVRQSSGPGSHSTDKTMRMLRHSSTTDEHAAQT